MMNSVAATSVDSYDFDEVTSSILILLDVLGQPLKRMITSESKVVIKPNWVSHRNLSGHTLNAVITHPTLIRAMVRIVSVLNPASIVVADTPQYDCDFSKILSYSSFGGVDALDLRDYWSRGKHFASELIKLPGDPAGKEEVDLGEKSYLSGIDMSKVYGARYNRAETRRAHSNGHHRYELSRTMTEADVLISMPKMKTHKKVGVTLNVKGLVGISTNKNLIPHYRLGPPSEGGDQYPDGLFTEQEEALIRLERWLYDQLLASGNKVTETIHHKIYDFHNRITKRFFQIDPEKRKLDTGNWYGNDTCWRSAADLYQILRQKNIQTFSLIDGIVGGEGDGPLAPTEKAAKLLVAGEDMLATDLAAISLMGFNYKKIPLYWRLAIDYPSHYHLLFPQTCAERSREFIPHRGWEGHI